MFQCPLGLELLQQAKNGDSVDEQFQCPLGLELLRGRRPNRIALGVFQCPLGLIPHFYGTPSKPRFYAVYRACFCRYLSEYSDNSRFSCMLTFWTYLMRCT